MAAPIRLIRAALETLPSERPYQTLSARERIAQGRLLEAAETLFSTFPLADLTIPALAGAMRLSAALIRRLFPDLESLLAAFLHRHLDRLAETLAALPADARSQPARFAAYRAATQDPFGGPAPAHAILLNLLPSLPPDLKAPLANRHLALGALLCPQSPALALTLLDRTGLTPDQVGRTIALTEPAARPAEAPAAPTRAPSLTPAPRSPAPRQPVTAKIPAAPRLAHSPTCRPPPPRPPPPCQAPPAKITSAPPSAPPRLPAFLPMGTPAPAIAGARHGPPPRAAFHPGFWNTPPPQAGPAASARAPPNPQPCALPRPASHSHAHTPRASPAAPQVAL